jgi:hypothetical protein
LYVCRRRSDLGHAREPGGREVGFTCGLLSCHPYASRKERGPDFVFLVCYYCSFFIYINLLIFFLPLCLYAVSCALVTVHLSIIFWGGGFLLLSRKLDGLGLYAEEGIPSSALCAFGDLLEVSERRESPGFAAC